MTTPEKQLNNLKKVKPDNSWKQENRRVLYNQISNSHVEQQQSLAERIREAFIGLSNSLSKPAWAVVIIAALVITGGLGTQASQYSKPGDTFYFTKKITEKLKLALTFDEQEKAKMSIQFSSGHARDITETLSDPAFNKESTSELQNSFREELMSVRKDLDSIAMSEKDDNIKENGDSKKEGDKQESDQGSEQDRSEQENISEMNNNVSQEAEQTPARQEKKKSEQEDEQEPAGDNNTQSEQLAEKDQKTATATDDNSMFIVESGKQENGQDIYIPEQDGQNKSGESDKVHQQMEEAGRKLENNSDGVDESSLAELYTLLDKAGEQFDQENYEQAKLLLDEFTEKFNSLQEEGSGENAGNGDGEVKGEFKEATTTESENKEQNSTTTEEEQ
jgi:hypothetical protein